MKRWAAVSPPSITCHVWAPSAVIRRAQVDQAAPGLDARRIASSASVSMGSVSSVRGEVMPASCT